MICNACADAGDMRLDDPGEATKIHEQCRGGNWCDCMHRVEGEWINPTYDDS